MTGHAGHVAIVAGAVAGLFFVFSRLAPPPRGPRPRAAGRAPARLFVAGNLAAGIVHLAVMPAHLGESILFGVFFFAVGVFQLVAARAGTRALDPRLLYAAAAVDVGVAVVWLVSRSLGLPVGPEPWTPEAVGAADLVTSGAELVAAWAGVRAAHLRRDASRGYRSAMRIRPPSAPMYAAPLREIDTGA